MHCFVEWNNNHKTLFTLFTLFTLCLLDGPVFTFAKWKSIFLHFPALFFKIFLLKLKLFRHNSYYNKNLPRNSPQNWQKSGYSILWKYPFWNKFTFKPAVPRLNGFKQSSVSGYLTSYQLQQHFLAKKSREISKQVLDKLVENRKYCVLCPFKVTFN